MTHSLEVAQIGKALALRLSADTALVEAICLAHDIGHPPFGHAGEEALHEVMAEVDGFNGNAQNIRILTNTEWKSVEYSGLNLTKATLDGLIKYPWPIDSSHQKGFYKSDESVVAAIRDPSVGDLRTFECQIMNWADDVAYSSHDLEDALVIGTVRREELDSATIQNRIFLLADRSYRKEHPEFSSRRPMLLTDVRKVLGGIKDSCMSADTDRLPKIKTYLAQHIDRCVTTPDVEEREHPLRRYRYSVKLNPEVVVEVEIMKAITFACVILTNPVLTLQQAGKRVVTDLYSKYSDYGGKRSGITRYLYPVDWIERVDNAINRAETKVEPFAMKRLARDYIATMTDRFAEEQWRRMNLPSEGSLFIARA